MQAGRRIEARVERAPRRLGRRRDQSCPGLDELVGDGAAVSDLEGDAHPRRDLATDLDLIDVALLGRVRELERGAPGVEDRDLRLASLVGALDG